MDREKQKHQTSNGYERVKEVLLGRYLSMSQLPSGAEDVTELLGVVRLDGSPYDRLETLEAAIAMRDEHIGAGRWVFFEKYPFGFDAETGEPLEDIEQTEAPLLEMGTALIPDDVNN